MDGSFLYNINNDAVETLDGIIESLMVINDCVYGIIRKNYDYKTSDDISMLDHGWSLFNNGDGSNAEERLLPELLIRTDINPISTVLDRYLGKPCSVTVVKGLAIFATITLGSKSIVNDDVFFFHDIREQLGEKDILSPLGIEYLKQKGMTRQNIDDLKSVLYKNTYKDKIITVEGEAVWYRDTSTALTNEVILKTNSIWQGLNKVGLKDNDYHTPTVTFSGL